MIVLLALACHGCHHHHDKDNDVDTGLDTGGLSDDSGDTDTDPVVGDGVISGTVRVRVLSTDADGTSTEIPWSDIGTLPFGGIFLAAFTTDPFSGETEWIAEDVLVTPTEGGDVWSLTLPDLSDDREVRVTAILDYYADGVLGTYEPTALHPERVTVAPLGEVSGIDLVIDTALSGGGGADTNTYAVIGGPVDLPGDIGLGCRSFLYTTSGSGPHYTGSVSSTDALWSLTAPVGYDWVIRGACDSDGNTLIDPTDIWGSYVAADGGDGNPYTVTADGASDLRMVIPLPGTGSGIVPELLLQGELVYADGFDTFPAGTKVYAVATRTSLTGDVAVSEFDFAYDTQVFDGASLVGTSLPFSLEVGPNRTVYVAAYVDEDGDGVVNEAGEAIGRLNGNGRLDVERTGQTGLIVSVQDFTATE